MTKNILITGGAGYIGSIFVPELINLGHNVTVIDNFCFKQTSLNHLCNHKNFSVINGDVRDRNLISNLLKSNDIIFPLAALVGAPLCKKKPEEAKSVNCDSIINMLKDLSKDQQVIMPTTNSAYGTGDENNLCDENSPLKPISQYASDKVEVEKELMSRENSISLRLATVFGMSPRMRLDLIVNDFTYRAVYDGALVLFEGHFKRNYIHVRDVSRAFIHALNNFSSMKNNVFNIGLSDANLSKIELCEEIKKVIKNFYFIEAGNQKDPDQRNYIVSNEKIEKTNFSPSYKLPEGIKELVKGYRMIKNSIYGNI